MVVAVDTEMTEILATGMITDLVGEVVTGVVTVTEVTNIMIGEMADGVEIGEVIAMVDGVVADAQEETVVGLVTQTSGNHLQVWIWVGLGYNKKDLSFSIYAPLAF